MCRVCVSASLPLCRPLHVAARRGLTVVVQELLGKEASVLAVDENGQLLCDWRLRLVLQRSPIS